MENILYNISQVLGITIIHSLWQGLFIYFVLRMALMFSAQISSSKKYLFSIFSLLAMAAWFIYTLVNEIHIYNWLAIKPEKLSAMPLMLALPAGINQLSDQSIRYYYSIEEYLPYISLLYIIGLLFNLSRLIMARKKINVIRQSMSIDVLLQQQINKFTGMLNISNKVTVGFSKLVSVPCMVGYFKPVILLPFTLATYLSTEEIEAILLHELAHIKRNDYLVNILQQVISTLLFFNPCTLLINKIINEERENCCDDLVIEATSSPLIYAKALFKLEQTRETALELTMPATGKKYQLLNRIERIMKTKNQTPSLRPALVAMLILTIGIGSIALLNPQIAQGKISVKAVAPVIRNLIADTTKKTTIKKTATTTKPRTAKKPVTKTTIADIPVDTTQDYSFHAIGKDKKLNELNTEIRKYSEAINAYYRSQDFRAVQRQIQQMGKEIQEYYNRPEFKKLQQEIGKEGTEYSMKWGPNAQVIDLTSHLSEQGQKIGAYYNSAEFKKINEELEKKYGVKHGQGYDGQDENYKKYLEEVTSRIPPEIKKLQEELTAMSKQISARYETPEYKQHGKHLQLLDDSISKIYNNPDFKKKQAEMEELGKKMSAYQNNPDIKKQQQMLEEAVKKMTAYIHSNEYRKTIEMKYDFHYNYKEKPEKPEQKEKTEKPEKPEQNN